MVAVQTALYVVNTHESGGYSRFLIPAAPWAAVCVPVAVAWFAQADAVLRRRFLGAALAITALAGIGFWRLWFSVPVPVVGAGVVLLAALVRPTDRRLLVAGLAVLVLPNWLYYARPHRLEPHQREVIDTTNAFRSSHPTAHVIGDNPWTDFATDVPRHPYFWAPNDWQKPPTLPLVYVWDEDHSSVNLPIADLTALPHDELGHDGTRYLRVFLRK